MKRPMSYENFIRTASQNKVPPGTSSSDAATNECFIPDEPLPRLKSLRSAPRKLTYVEEHELEEFDSWLDKEDLKKEQKSNFKLPERKARPEKVISVNDEMMLYSNPVFRKISFTPIPSHLKPHFEKEETFVACTNIEELMILRNKYIFYDDFVHQNPYLRTVRPVEHTHVFEKLKECKTFEFSKGLFWFSGVELETVSRAEFYEDVQYVMENIYHAANKSFCYLRLKMLMKKFKMHLECNVDREMLNQKVHSRKDFYTIMKVDNHIHLATCMNQKHLQKFIKTKLKQEPDTIVCSYSDTNVTLHDLSKNLGFEAATLELDVIEHEPVNSNRYSYKYNPLNTVSLKEIFLSTDNYLSGRYFAELIKEVIEKIDFERNVLAEYRIPIYGRDRSDWLTTANWLKTNNIKSPRVRWVIQIPQLYSLFRKCTVVLSFSDLLKNIFAPIFEASLFPEQHPEISEFLTKVVGFDLLNDEEKIDKITSYVNYKTIDPEDWTCDQEPTYSYWSYYLYSNLVTLNHLRRAKGLNTFAYRPHCGEIGSHEHMATGYLLANSINHGIKLAKIPVIQYLFYLQQIGIAMSPLSNNKSFVKFLKNPLPKFFVKGLNVALATDDPLSTHLTREPLMEEFSVAAQTLDLNAVDLCELARNSVVQSGFSVKKKKEWLGERFLEGVNDPSRSNVSLIRFEYRLETFQEEHRYLMRQAYNEEEI